MNKTTLFVSALVLAMSSAVTTISYAASHENKAEDAEEMECVTEEALEAMSEEASEALETPVCEDEEEKAPAD
jgi:sensor domain CHASE-containing protein